MGYYKASFSWKKISLCNSPLYSMSFYRSFRQRQEPILPFFELLSYHTRYQRILELHLLQYEHQAGTYAECIVLQSYFSLQNAYLTHRIHRYRFLLFKRRKTNLLVSSFTKLLHWIKLFFHFYKFLTVFFYCF